MANANGELDDVTINADLKADGDAKLASGTVGLDYYGRPTPRHAHGTAPLDRWTSSTRRIAEGMMALYDRIVDPDLLIRRVYVVAVELIREKDIPPEGPLQLDLFTDYETLVRCQAKDKEMDQKEKRLQETALALQERFGKNAMIKAMNLEEGGTTIQRNKQIGGHKAE